MTSKYKLHYHDDYDLTNMFYTYANILFKENNGNNDDNKIKTVRNCIKLSLFSFASTNNVSTEYKQKT